MPKSSRGGSAAPKRDHHKFRGTPPPATFSLAALPDDALLTEYETASIGRWSTNTLAAWRLRRDHALRWVIIGGGRIRYRAADIRAYLADATPRTKPPAAPAAELPKRRLRSGTSTTTTGNQDVAPDLRRAPRRPRAAEAAPQEEASR